MTSLAETFSALADENRLAMVERLMTEGELPAGALVQDAGISGPAISRHLRVLREAGVISQRAEGTKRFYSVRRDALKAISNWTIDHRYFWESGLDRLETMLAEESE
ncbi:metalloregulator ArsR/SmtB family transcription factor [Shimia sp.]|uniref:ArsR/SmtB family transcription factor n=1 Tax=Shimia sp. TaxID=1954381 RepID=UPI003297F605